MRDHLTPVATTTTGCVEYQGCQPDLPVVWCVHDEAHNWPTATRGCPDAGVCFDADPAIGLSSRASSSLEPNVRISRTFLWGGNETTAFFRIFSSHARRDFE